ncbi:MAG: hypothetical protein MJE68_02415, partial [Proteobacteria bacterium]|nr:hypothetical protein [Pseudomonadota bacterium]
MEQLRDWRIYYVFHWNGFKFDKPMVYVRGQLSGAELLPKSYDGKPRQNYKHVLANKKATEKERMEASKLREYHMSFSHRPDRHGITQQKKLDLNANKRKAKEMYERIKNEVKKDAISDKCNGNSNGGYVSVQDLRKGVDDDTYEEFIQMAKSDMAAKQYGFLCDVISMGEKTPGDDDDDGNEMGMFDDVDIEDLIDDDKRLAPCVLRGTDAWKEKEDEVEDKRNQIINHLIVSSKNDYVRTTEVGEFDIMYVADEYQGRKRGKKLNESGKELANVTKLEHPCVNYHCITSSWENPERPITDDDKHEALAEENRLKEHNDWKQQRKKLNKDGTKMSNGEVVKICNNFHFEMVKKYNPTSEELLDEKDEREKARLTSPRTGILHHIFIVYAIVDVLLTVIIMWIKYFFDNYLS